jgi:predicted amidophosphoribosyltransferase
MTSECAACYQEIPDNRSLCEACENDLRAEQAQAGDAERIYKERQARAMTVE